MPALVSVLPSGPVAVGGPFRKKPRGMRVLRPLVGSSRRTQPGVESLKELVEGPLIPYDDLKVPNAMMAAMGQVTNVLQVRKLAWLKRQQGGKDAYPLNHAEEYLRPLGHRGIAACLSSITQIGASVDVMKTRVSRSHLVIELQQKPQDASRPVPEVTANVGLARRSYVKHLAENRIRGRAPDARSLRKESFHCWVHVVTSVA